MKQGTTNLSRKLIMISMAIVLITSVLIGISVFYFMAGYSRESERELAHDLLEQYGQNIDNVFAEIERIAFLIARDQNVVDLLEDKYTYIEERYNQQLVVEDDLYASMNYSQHIFGIYLFAESGEQYYNILSPAIDETYTIQEEPWYNRAVEGNVQLVYRETDGKFMVARKAPLLSYVRYIYQFPDDTYLGALEIDINADFFEPTSRLDTADSHDSVSFFVMTEEGEMVFQEGESLGDDMAGQILKQAEAEQENQARDISAGDSVTLSWMRSEQTGWIYGSVVEMDVFPALLSAVTTIIVVAIGIAFVCALFFSRYMGVKLFAPLQQLREAMYCVKGNDLSVRANIQSKDEIGEVASMFNGMVESLDNMVHTVIALEADKKELVFRKLESEMEALQAQINPHFLYNTLESISMTARMNHDIPAQKMAVSLGKLLRLSIVRGEKVGSLTEEIEHAQCYLEIQKIRYEEKFDAYFDVDEQALEARTLKIILQPVIENAILHGIEPMQGKGKIVIRIRREGQLLKIAVEDNGVGMAPDTMEAMNQALAEGKNVSGKGSIGMTNTSRRIRLHFGAGPYGLRIVSSGAEGTTVEITLPFITEERSEEEE